MKLYHGTTSLQAIRAILSGEEKPYSNSVWSCSDGDSYLYMWNQESFMYGGDDEDDARGQSINYAFESAACQALLTDGSDPYIYVLELDVDEEDTDTDDTDENMSNALVVASSTVPEYAHTAKVYRVRFPKWYYPAWLAGLLDRGYFNEERIDPDLLHVASTLDYNSLIDDMLELFYDYEEVGDFVHEVPRLFEITHTSISQMLGVH